MAKDTVQFMFIDGVELVIQYDWEVLAKFWMNEMGSSASISVGNQIIRIDKILWIKKV